MFKQTLTTLFLTLGATAASFAAHRSPKFKQTKLRHVGAMLAIGAMTAMPAYAATGDVLESAGALWRLNDGRRHPDAREVRTDDRRELGQPRVPADGDDRVWSPSAHETASRSEVRPVERVYTARRKPRDSGRYDLIGGKIRVRGG